MSPFQALFGRIPPTIPPYIQGSTTIQSLDELLTERDQLLRTLKDNLLEAQHRMQQKSNTHHRELEFQVNDTVLLRLQPYRQSTVSVRSNHKLAKRFFGPFRVLERIGQVAYRLELPQGCKIHPVFHVSLLKPYSNSASLDIDILPSHFFQDNPISMPAVICATRKILHQGQLHRQILVQWTHSSPENATWENFEEFCKSYSEFHLEDKVIFPAEGNDMIQPLQLEVNSKKTGSNQDTAAIVNQEGEGEQTSERVQNDKRNKKTPNWLKD